MRGRIVLVGAGSAMFTRGLVADLIRRGEPIDLALVDVSSEPLEVAERLTRKMIAARHALIRLSASADRREVLRDATAVICTIGVGGRRGWEQDAYIPRRYGIYQPVGDSVMPGGTSRALRMIPPMVEIAEDVLELAPDALFFNYGNPLPCVCRAVRKATGAPVVGLCHGVFHVAQFLAKEMGVEFARTKYAAVGMNHLTWFTEVRIDGRDALPRLREIGRGKLERMAAGEVSAEEISPFSWQMLELFGAFPAVLDRHVTEFFPHLFAGEKQYYGKTLGVDCYSVEGIIGYGDSIYNEMKERAFSPEPLAEDYFDTISGEHEQVVEIIDSIRQDAGRIYSVNLPNRGQVPNLPDEAILETPAIAEGAGLRPIAQPPLPAGLVGTLATRLAWVETVVEAALEGSRTKFVQALLLDGAVSSVEVAERLADELLAAHAGYLPQFGKGK